MFDRDDSIDPFYLAQLAKELGLKTANFSVSGSGDSGEVMVEELQFVEGSPFHGMSDYDAQGALGGIPVMPSAHAAPGMAENFWSCLENAVDSLLPPGWDQNEGSSGNVVLDFASADLSKGAGLTLDEFATCSVEYHIEEDWDPEDQPEEGDEPDGGFRP